MSTRALGDGVAFRGRLEFCSNFWESAFTMPVVWQPGGVVIPSSQDDPRAQLLAFPSGEHAFQYLKATDPQIAEEVRTASTPGEAKGFGRRLRCRPDWERVKVEAMRMVLAAKFSEPETARLLVATGQEELVELNTWHDTTWGVCGGRCKFGPHEPTGANWLGRLLVERRSLLAAALPQQNLPGLFD